MPSSLLTFSTKAKLPTATASDHRASRTDNSSQRAISTHWRPVQQWIFHQAELTTLWVLRYSSGHRKGRLKILCINCLQAFVSIATVLDMNFAGIIPRFGVYCPTEPTRSR
jgi:hypothetical protein